MGRRPRLLDGTLLVMVALLAVLAYLAHLRGGPDLARGGFAAGVDLLYRFGPLIVVSFLAAGFADALIPTEWVRRSLGEQSGVRGILIATAAGVITPSGPFVSMPVAAVMLRSGAAPGPVVAFLTAWSLLAVHRLIAWEVPILGWRFAALRYGACLLLAPAAGLLVRLVTR